MKHIYENGEKGVLSVMILLMVSSLTVRAIDVSRYHFHSMPKISYYGGIRSVAKDSIGRMWFSDLDAVFMFNGDRFERMNDAVTTQISGSSWAFGTLVIGRDKSLYMGTNNGLLRFNYGEMLFELAAWGNVESLASDSDGVLWLLSDGKIKSFDFSAIPQTNEYPLPESVETDWRSMVICAGSDVYFATNGALYRLNPATGDYECVVQVGGGSAIYDAIEFDGFLYVLTQMHGLYQYDADRNLVRHFTMPPEYEKSAESKKLYLDKNNIIWIATQSGLLLLEPETGEMGMIQTNLRSPYPLPNNSVWSIYPDPDGGVWVGTYGGKLAYVTSADSDIINFKAAQGGLSHNIVSCFEEDDKGNIWIGTEGGGICYWDRERDEFTNYSLEMGCGLASNMIKRLVYDKGERLLVSSFRGGVQAFDEDKRRFYGVTKHYPPLSVYDFVRDGSSGMWVSNPDTELIYEDLRNGKAYGCVFRDDGGREVEIQVETMFQDMQGNLWLVSRNGVYIVNAVTGRILDHICIDGTVSSANNLCSYCRASDGSIWFGTKGGGVNRLSPNGKYVNFRDRTGNGLDGRTVFGILEDSISEDIWLSTDDGLYVYDRADDIISKTQIDMPDLCGAYYVRSCFRTSKGEMLFGGTDGFILFHPQMSGAESRLPEAYFTDLLVNNEKVFPGDRTRILKKDISTISYNGDNSTTITLPRRYSNFEIRFASNSYIDVQKNRYSYRMLGLGRNWQDLPYGQQSIQFFNLPAGKYVLSVKTSNGYGQWGDKETSLRIRIKPSPFMSPLACVIYLILFLSVIYLIWRYFTNKRFFEQKLLLEEIKEENMRKLTQARINFFTNISHDLKTPLTLVIDPLKQLKEELPENSSANAYIHLIERNVERIQHTISQLLKFREIESQKITLDKRPGDLIRFVKNIFLLFELYTKRKGIDTEFSSQYDEFHTSFDYDVVEKIVTNLFSNAVKYTVPNGYVGVFIRKANPAEIPDRSLSGEYISITVSNTGKEISENDKLRIFESFGRLSNTDPEFESSSGLGLSIVRELVENMGGVITLNTDGSKISFNVVLPFVPNADREKNEGPESFDYAVSEIDNMIVEDEEILVETNDTHKFYDIVVIEDDAPLRGYLKQSLSKYYNVYTASNGVGGIARTEQVLPYIVITDLIMPRMDGFEVCRVLRSNAKTSHIPLIVLSAASDDNSRIRAIEAGATVFIDKPVDMDYLLGQIAGLIRSCQDLKEFYSKKYIVEPSKVEVSSIDEELLQRAMVCIEKNMGNCDYGVDDFVSDMLIGRTRLYNKIKELTDMSIKGFIMSIRLKRAEQLIGESDLTISEISDMTGFSSPKYFSVCFKSRYGLSPSEYTKKKR